METISQNAAFNQFHNTVVDESNIAFLPPPDSYSTRSIWLAIGVCHLNPLGSESLFYYWKGLVAVYCNCKLTAIVVLKCGMSDD